MPLLCVSEFRWSVSISVFRCVFRGAQELFQLIKPPVGLGDFGLSSFFISIEVESSSSEFWEVFGVALGFSL